MPKFKALYYPYFQPPKRWLRKYLLVFDSITTIVPKDVSLQYSQPLLELIDTIPEGFETISPSPEDKLIEEASLKRVDKAFQIIKDAKPLREKPDEITLTIDLKKSGELSIEGHELIHSDKFSKEIRSLLEKHNLIKPTAAELIDSLSSNNKGFEVVNEDASDIIMSLLADKIGRRKSLYTVTDKKLDFAVNALNAFEFGYVGDPEGMLIGLILKYEIPTEIEALSLDEYIRLRNAYSEIRESFCKAVYNLVHHYNRLGRITDFRDLQEKVKEITRGFDNEVNKFKRTTYAKKLMGWDTITIGSLTQLVGIIFERLPSELLSLASSVLIKFIDKFRYKFEEESTLTKTQRLIAGLQEDIIDAAEIRKLI